MTMQISAALLIFAMTIATSLIALFGAPQLLDRSLFRPYSFLRRRQYDTVIMSGFVHADLMHLLFNMLTFYFFGFGLERRIGTTSFVVLYLAGLLLSHLGTWYKHRNNPEYACLGASGAISAVVFAAILYNPYASMFILPIPFPIPAPLFAILYLGYTYYASQNQVGRINHDAHLGGALTGLAFVALTDPGRYPAFFDALF
jgi:membrane associated rhomboid family serine protease